MNLLSKSAFAVCLLAATTSEITVQAQPGPAMSPAYGYRSAYPGMQPGYPGAMPNTPPTRFGPAPQTSPYGYTRPSYIAPSNPASVHGPGEGIRPSAPADTSRMQQALRQQDFDRIEKENQDVRRRTRDIQDIGSELPVEDRLKLPLIKHMYRQGSDIIDQGHDAKDPSKIKMGIQQINDANERMKRLENDMQHRGGQGGQERSGRGQGQGRRNR